jgi:hypothetical protein
MPAATHTLTLVHQERDLLRLERDLLRREIEAAHTREQAALDREQAAREREVLLLRMLEQVQQQNQHLLEAPRSVPAPSAPAPRVRCTRATLLQQTLQESPPPSARVYDPEAAVRRMQALQAQGLSLAQVAAQLTAEGIPTRHGKPWHKGTVGYLLQTSGR